MVNEKLVLCGPLLFVHVRVINLRAWLQAKRRMNACAPLTCMILTVQINAAGSPLHKSVRNLVL